MYNRYTSFDQQKGSPNECFYSRLSNDRSIAAQMWRIETRHSCVCVTQIFSNASSINLADVTSDARSSSSSSGGGSGRQTDHIVNSNISHRLAANMTAFY